jgi:hypothetical protein
MQRKMHLNISSANIFSDQNKKKEQREVNMFAVELTYIVTKVKDLNRMCYLALGRAWIIVSRLPMTIVVGLDCVLKQRTKMTSYIIEM